MRPDRLVLTFLTTLFVVVASSVNAEDARDQAHEQIVELALKHINLQRAINGVGRLTPNRRLSAAAQKHAGQMARRDFVDHQSPDGRSLQDRIATAGYSWRVIAENLSAGQPSPESTVQSWMTSPAHRNNMLNPDYREVGVGYSVPSKEGKRQRYRNYWVVVFGARSR